MAKVPVRGAFSYDGDQVSADTGLLCADDSLTVQSAKDECDINVLVKRFGITRELPQNVKVPLQGDFSQVGDFKSAMDLIAQAENSFLEMPAEVRARFHHDPGELVAFVSQDVNRAEAERLGIVLAKPVPVPVPAAPAS